MPPTSIDGTDISGATIDGTEVSEITVDGDVVFSASQTLNVLAFHDNSGGLFLKQYSNGSYSDIRSYTGTGVSTFNKLSIDTSQEKVVGAFSSNSAQIFDINQSNETTSDSTGGSTYVVDISPDMTEMIVLGDAADAHVFDMSDYSVKTTFSSDNSSVSSSSEATYSPDGSQIAITAGGTTEIIETTNYTQEQQISNGDLRVRWKPDGSELAVGSNPVEIYDTSTWNSLGTLSNTTQPDGLAYSKDGNLIGVADDSENNFQIYDAGTYSQQDSISKSGGMLSVAFSPDNNHVAFGGRTGSVYIHEVDTVNGTLGNQVQTYSVADRPYDMRFQ